MAAVVTGVLGNLIPLQLLQDEYKLQRGVKEQIESLARELESMHAALSKVAEVPHDELDPQPQVKLWASEIREASYDMEDVIDTFLVRVDGDNNQTADGDDKTLLNRLCEKMGNLFSLSKIKTRREIANTIKNITKQVEEITKRRDRYKVDDHVANNSTTTTNIDPRLFSHHTKASELVGIDKPRDALLKKLSRGDDDASDRNTKVVSIFGCGGLGKTTLAKAVYNKLTVDMNIHCKAFVPVGQKPDLKKVFRDILLDLDEGYYKNNINFLMTLDERRLVDQIQGFLKEKRYIIVMDDIWEVSTWDAIRSALNGNNLGSKIITTTRCIDVAHAKQVQYSYQLMPLLHESSEILFYGRIFGSKEKCPERFFSLSQSFLKKCGGVPLAIITLSSLLADKLKDIDDWERLCNAIGSGISSSEDGMQNMGKILSLSYYDLPSHLKTCFLYLSMFPEDYKIDREQLIRMWIAEGFIQPQNYGDDLFVIGETYFNELINRSLLQPVGSMDSSVDIYACRVHDMILDLIRSLSREENFVTTSNQVISSETKQIHRLSLNNTTTCPKVGLSRVRSLAMFNLSLHSLPSLSSFGVLRVLVLDGKSEGLNVGNLIHLRLLWLYGTGLKGLPEGIEKLQYLQVLKCGDLYLDVLDGPSLQPSFLLKRLVCLEGISCYPWKGNLRGNLASLQVLWTLHVNCDTVLAVVELGCLTKLTKLRIEFEIELCQIISGALISSLNKLQRLRELHITQHPMWGENNVVDWEKWTPPLHLRKLRLVVFSSLQTLPKWISPTSLPHLTDLSLYHINVVRPNDIQILGELPSLSTLNLWAGKGNREGPLQKFMVSDDAFPRATFCTFTNVVIVPSMFPQGAMSRVKVFYSWVRAWDFFSNDGLDFNDLAMEQFPSLEKVWFHVIGSNSEEVEKVKEALKHAADAHPNHPSINFTIVE